MEMISVPSIMAIVGIIITLLKLAFKKYDNFANFVPLLSSLLGAILGIVAFYAVPAIMPTDNIFHAILFGLFSGMSATGSEQLIVQLKQYVATKKQQTADTKKGPVVSTGNKTLSDTNANNEISIEKIDEIKK